MDNEDSHWAKEENMMSTCVKGTSGAGGGGAADFFTGSGRKNMAADVKLL